MVDARRRPAHLLRRRHRLRALVRRDRPAATRASTWRCCRSAPTSRSWFMRPMHMNPEEAVRAAGDLGARRMATMHWGTFALTAEPLLEPRGACRSRPGQAAGRDRGRPLGPRRSARPGESRYAGRPDRGARRGARPAARPRLTRAVAAGRRRGVDPVGGPGRAAPGRPEGRPPAADRDQRRRPPAHPQRGAGSGRGGGGRRAAGRAVRQLARRERPGRPCRCG